MSCELLVDPIPRPRPEPFTVTMTPPERRVVLVDNRKPNSVAILWMTQQILRERGIDVEDQIRRKPSAGIPMVTAAELNGRVLIKYGGTRFPQAPPDATANYRLVSSRPPREVREKYLESYGAALTALTKRFGVIPRRLVCNQITPGVVRMLGELTGLPPSSVVISGPDIGHLGPADVIVGIVRLRRDGQLDGPVAIAASTPYAFGFGLVTPADHVVAAGSAAF